MNLGKFKMSHILGLCQEFNAQNIFWLTQTMFIFFCKLNPFNLLCIFFFLMLY